MSLRRPETHWRAALSTALEFMEPLSFRLSGSAFCTLTLPYFTTTLAYSIPILERHIDPESCHKPDVKHSAITTHKTPKELWSSVLYTDVMPFLPPPLKISQQEVNIENWEMEASGIVFVVWKRKKKPKDSPLGQNLSRGAQDTTCDQMNEANSTSQHFDPVSKFSVNNLNPPEIIWIPCPILPHKSRKKKIQRK